LPLWRYLKLSLRFIVYFIQSPNQTFQPTPSRRRERLNDEWSEW
jgi:hypothetical protein